MKNLSMDLEAIKTAFPFFKGELLSAIENNGIIKQIPARKAILSEGDMVHSLPFVLDGLLKVSRNEEEKEILLYYIKPGESCVMSFSACISNKKSEIKAVTEKETKILLVPSYLIEEMVKNHFFLNQYFHDLYNLRYLDLLDTVDDLIFRKMDERILNYLEERAVHFANRHLKLTHAEIAQDLGTAREVVSRVLKKLEKDGKLKITRNEIILL